MTRKNMELRSKLWHWNEAGLGEIFPQTRCRDSQVGSLARGSQNLPCQRVPKIMFEQPWKTFRVGIILVGSLIHLLNPFSLTKANLIEQKMYGRIY